MSKSARLILASVALIVSAVGMTMMLRAYFLTTTETPLADAKSDLPTNPALNVLGVSTDLGSAASVWGESLSVSGLTLASSEISLVQKSSSGQRILKASNTAQQALAAVSARAIDIKFYGSSAFTYILPLSLETKAEVWGFDGKALQKLYSAPAGVDITSAVFDPVSKFLYWVEVESNGNSSIYLQTARGEQNLIRTRIFGELVKLTYYEALPQVIYYNQGNKCFSTHTVKTDTLEIACTQLPQIGKIQNYYTEFSDPTKFQAGSGDKLWRFNYGDKSTQAALSLSGQKLISAYAAAGKYFAALVQGYTFTSNGQILLANPEIQLFDLATKTETLELPEGIFADLQLTADGQIYALTTENSVSVLWKWDAAEEEWVELTVQGCTTGCNLSFYK